MIPKDIQDLISNFGGYMQPKQVIDLVKAQVLLVEDGNHGEYRPRSSEFVLDGVPFIRPDDLKDGRVDFDACDRINQTAFYRVRKGKGRGGDVVFTHRATVGRIARVSQGAPDFVANPGVTIWRSINPNILDTAYLYYFMKTAPFMNQVWAEAGNTDTFPYVSLTQQRRLWIALPSIEMQRRIGAVLAALDDKIDLNRRMNKTLEAMARAIFKAWFVDFEPVKAKTAGARGFYGMSQAVFAALPDQLVQSEVGPVPQGWEVGTLADISDLNPESWTGDKSPNSIEYVDLANTKWGVIEKTDHYPWSDAPSRARRILRRSDTIVGTVRPGNGSYALVTRSGLTASTGFAVLRPRQPYYRELTYYAATSAENIERLAHLADGAAYPAVRPHVVLNTEIVLAPRSIVEAFSALSAPLVERIAANRKENETLAAILRAVLPKLMTGEITALGSESRADGE